MTALTWPRGQAIVIGISRPNGDGYGYIHVGEPAAAPAWREPYKTTFYRAERLSKSRTSTRPSNTSQRPLPLERGQFVWDRDRHRGNAETQPEMYEACQPLV